MVQPSYIAKRIAGTLIVVLGIITLVFILLRLTPGDPARVALGIQATQQQVNMLRAELGLNQPIYIQYVIYLENVFLHFDLGNSILTGQPVASVITQKLPYTLELAVSATALAVVLGILLGVIAATHKKLDKIVMAVAVTGVSMPSFWLGLLLILAFAVDFRLFPASGAYSPLSIVLPSLTLAFLSMGLIARMTRANTIGVLKQDFIRAARGRGLPERSIVYKHALRNALIPVVTVIGLQFGILLGGAVITETVFAWPGIGRLLVQSVLSRDYPVIQGVILVFGLMYAFVNLAFDLIYTVIDARVKLQ